MKNKQSASKPKNQLTNMLRKLLHWMSQLELSGEHDIGQRMPELSFADSMKGNKRNDNRPINEIQMKPNNQLTNMLMELLHWMSHLELSGGKY